MNFDVDDTQTRSAKKLTIAQKVEFWRCGNPINFKRKFECKHFIFSLSYRSKENLWGRFGGGWNWKLGFQAGGSTVIISLLVCEIRICIKKDGDK